MESSRKKSKLADYSKELWELNVCVSCARSLDTSSKLLSCLHGMCRECITLHFNIQGHYVCKCRVATDISNELPNISLYCEEFDESIIRNSYYMDEEYQKKMYGKYRTKTPCPNCVGKFIEVYCTTCNELHCSLCQLMRHQSHTFKSIAKVMEDIRLNLMISKADLSDKLNFVNQAKSTIASNINTVKIQKREIKKEIFEKFAEIRSKLKKAEDKMIGYVESYHKAKLENLSENKVAMDRLTKKYDFYLYFSESALKRENKADLDITNSINNQLLQVRKGFTKDISRLHESNPNMDLKVKFDETLNRLIDSVRRVVIYRPKKFLQAIDAFSEPWNITLFPEYERVNKMIIDIPKIIDDHAVDNIIIFNRIKKEKKSLKYSENDSSYPDSTPIYEIQPHTQYYENNMVPNSEYSLNGGCWRISKKVNAIGKFKISRLKE